MPLCNVDVAAADVSQITGRNKEKINRTIDDFEKFSRNIDKTGDKFGEVSRTGFSRSPGTLRSSSGTLGKLVTDDSLHRDAQTLIRGITGLASNLKRSRDRGQTDQRPGNVLRSPSGNPQLKQDSGRHIGSNTNQHSGRRAWSGAEIAAPEIKCMTRLLGRILIVVVLTTGVAHGSAYDLIRAATTHNVHAVDPDLTIRQ